MESVLWHFDVWNLIGFLISCLGIWSLLSFVIDYSCMPPLTPTVMVINDVYVICAIVMAFAFPKK